MELPRASRFAAIDVADPSRADRPQMWSTTNPLAYFGQGADLLRSYASGFNPEPDYGRAQAASASAGKAMASAFGSAGRGLHGLASKFGGSLFG